MYVQIVSVPKNCAIPLQLWQSSSSKINTTSRKRLFEHRLFNKWLMNSACRPGTSWPHYTNLSTRQDPSIASKWLIAKRKLSESSSVLPASLQAISVVGHDDPKMCRKSVLIRKTMQNANNRCNNTLQHVISCIVLMPK